ncbi:MAG: methyltransferase domain-containing protein [Thermoplasmata archaeon]|nr:methyltransferase domain-containing protein [Thermoplasmata archaeon]
MVVAPFESSQHRTGSTKKTLRESWNALSSVYRRPHEGADPFGHEEGEYLEWLRPLLGGLPVGSKVLDLGCGTGVPASRLLSTKFDVRGVDLSDVMVRRARRLVPGANFLRADMAAVQFDEGEFAAVIALYSIIHVPIAEQRPFFRNVRRWLRPGGWFLAVLGHGAVEGWEEGWLGSEVPMYWSHADARTYRRWLTSAGFEILAQTFVPERDGGHELFLTRARPFSESSGSSSTHSGGAMGQTKSARPEIGPGPSRVRDRRGEAT